MAPVEKISIALPADMISLVREAVETGDYASTSEVIREALREWKAKRVDRANAVAEIRALWEEGLASGPGTDEPDFSSVKQRARARLERSRKKPRQAK